MSTPGEGPAPAEPAVRKASFLETFKAVGASFFGVRGRKAHESDLRRLNPVHVIVVGVVCAVLFILLLLTAARAFVSAAAS